MRHRQRPAPRPPWPPRQRLPASAPVAITAAAPMAAVSAAAESPAAAPVAAASQAPEPAAAPQPAPVATPAPPPPPPSRNPACWTSCWKIPLTLLGGGLLIALLAGLGIYKARQRREAAEVDSAFLESRLQPDSFFGASGGQRVDTERRRSDRLVDGLLAQPARCGRRRRSGGRSRRLPGLRARHAGRGNPQGSPAHPSRAASPCTRSCWTSTPSGAIHRHSRPWPRRHSAWLAATAPNGPASANKARASIRRIRCTGPAATPPPMATRWRPVPMRVMAATSMATQKIDRSAEPVEAQPSASVDLDLDLDFSLDDEPASAIEEARPSQLEPTVAMPPLDSQPGDLDIDFGETTESMTVTPDQRGCASCRSRSPCPNLDEFGRYRGPGLRRQRRIPQQAAVSFGSTSPAPLTLTDDDPPMPPGRWRTAPASLNFDATAPNKLTASQTPFNAPDASRNPACWNSTSAPCRSIWTPPTTPTDQAHGGTGRPLGHQAGTGRGIRLDRRR